MVCLLNEYMYDDVDINIQRAPFSNFAQTPKVGFPISIQINQDCSSF